MKKIFLAIFLLTSTLAFSQSVRTTITSDGTNVTVSTPVNTKVIPVCDFHWSFSDGNLKLWIEGNNEIIPGGRLGSFTVSGATTQASKLAALGAISDQCNAGGGLDSLYYGTTLLENGDTIAVGGGNTIYTASDSITGGNRYVAMDVAGDQVLGIGYFENFPDYGYDVPEYGLYISPQYYQTVALVNGVDQIEAYNGAINLTSNAGNGASIRVDGANNILKLSADNINFFDKYDIPKTEPSNTNLIKSIMTWTGNGTTTTPAFELISGLSGVNGIYGGDGTAPADVDVTVADSINFDAGTLIVDGVNNRVGVGISSAAPASQLSVRRDNIGVTQNNAYGIVLANNTAAAAGSQQMSPGLRWRGNGWKTNATAESQTVDFLADVLPVQGTSAPTGTWQLKASIDGGTYSNLLSINSAGLTQFSNNGSNIFTIGNLGSISIGNGTVLTGTSPLIYSTGTASGSVSASGRNLGFYCYNSNNHSSSTVGAFDFTGVDFAASSGTQIGINYSKGFAPTSGTCVFNSILSQPTINQTGGANGITRGLYVNPTITAAANWRSIETSNTTGYSLYTASAPTYFGGNVGIGTTSADRQLHNEVSDAATNTVTYGRRQTHVTSGTAAAGFGAGSEIELENGSGTNVVAQTQETTWSDATNGSEDATYTLKLVRGGTLTTAATVTSLGALTPAGRLQQNKGADVASANDLTLGTDGNVFHITGTTQINAITTAGWSAGEIILIFDASVTVKNNTVGGAGTAVMILAGGVDFSATANDVLKLVYDGTRFFEVSRSVN